jgi:hypothetical protein
MENNVNSFASYINSCSNSADSFEVRLLIYAFLLTKPFYVIPY